MQWGTAPPLDLLVLGLGLAAWLFLFGFGLGARPGIRLR
jgi:hypothetical protein